MKERKFNLLAITLGIIGALLLIVSISLYALGLHSSSQLDKLNVTSSIPVSTPVIPIVVSNTLIEQDLISDQKKDLVEMIEKKIGKKPYIFSSISNDGIENLVKALFEQCLNNND